MLTDLCNTSDWKTAPCWSFFFSFFQWEHLSWGQVLCLVPSLQTAIPGNPCRCRGLQGSTPPRKEWATQRLLGTAFQAECPEQGAGGKHLAAVCGWGREEGGEILGQPPSPGRSLLMRGLQGTVILTRGGYEKKEKRKMTWFIPSMWCMMNHNHKGQPLLLLLLLLMLLLLLTVFFTSGTLWGPFQSSAEPWLVFSTNFDKLWRVPQEGTWKTSCWVREARPESPHVVWFGLHEIFKAGKCIETAD